MPFQSELLNDSLQADRCAGIVIHVGTNDCASVGDPGSIVTELEDLVKCTKSKFVDCPITMSSICPRLDAHETQMNVDLVNAGLSTICLEQEVEYVNHDKTFRYKNDEIVSDYLDKAGLHLSYLGSCRLRSDLKLPNLSVKAGKRGKLAQKPKSSRTHQSNRTRGKNNSKGGAKCWYCGEPGHVAKDCRHGGKIKCNLCGQLGHKAKYCKNDNSNS